MCRASHWLALLPGQAARSQLFHDLTVVRLVEKGAQALGDDGADVSNASQLLQRSVHDRIELAEVPGQCLGGGLPHMADTQAEQKARQRRLL